MLKRIKEASHAKTQPLYLKSRAHCGNMHGLVLGLFGRDPGANATREIANIDWSHFRLRRQTRTW